MISVKSIVLSLRDLMRSSSVQRPIMIASWQPNPTPNCAKRNAIIKIVYVLSRRDDIAPKAFYEILAEFQWVTGAGSCNLRDPRAQICLEPSDRHAASTAACRSRAA